MSRPYLGLTINEGYTDLGTFNIEITAIENPINNQDLTKNVDLTESRNLLFKLEFASDGSPVLPDYKLKFTAKGRISDEDVDYETTTNESGYVQIESPLLPAVKLVENTATIRYEVRGPLNERAKECYLMLDGHYYTLITDIIVDSGFLCIYVNDNAIKIDPVFSVGDYCSAIHITRSGEIFIYDYSIPGWTSIGTLTFYMIEFPENLTIVADGLYEESGTSGTIISGTLGSLSTDFEEFYGVVTNPEPFVLDIDVDMYNPGSVAPDFSESLVNVVQGSSDVNVISVTSMPYSEPDESPTLEQIETVAGITFSGTFSTFLTTKGLTTLEKIRKAGPITYINDYPLEGVGATELRTLQGHVDLYALNKDIEENQVIIAANYPTLYKIANTAKDVFLTAVVGEDLPLFKAAKIHEVASQNMRLVSNMLAGTLSDLKLVNPSVPDVEGSSFRSLALAPAASSCGCSDCTSQLSPFAYLMALIDYSAKHVSGFTYSCSSPNYSTFQTYILSKFYQPFTTLNVDCETLHDEYCRVRLVTEVLEQVVDNSTLPSIRTSSLAVERNQFLMLVYQAILHAAGTSINEVRDVYNIQSANDKLEAAKRLSQKLTIPLYIPTTTNYTVDVLWLTIGNPVSTHELTADNLELIFGFRNTKRNVLTPTPTSYMETWRDTYLRDKWKSEDYLFNEFSREDVVPGNSATYKAVWKPLIDPDNIGWEDFSFNPYAPIRDLYLWRKADTDEFLKYWLTNTDNISRTAADLNGYILRVKDRNISSDSLESDKIQIYDGTSWDDYFVINKVLIGTNTDIVLKKSTSTISQPALIQPRGTPAMMRFKRVLIVPSPSTQITGSGPFTLTWTDDVIADQLSYAKLISTGDSTVYQTSDSSIVSITFTNSKQVSLTLSSAPNSGFKNGTVSFIYEVEVPLCEDAIFDPNKVAFELFNTQLDYYYLTPGEPTSVPDPFSYFVWNTPSWTGISGTTDFEKLKSLYRLFLTNTANQSQLAIISDDLFLSSKQFSRMMEIMIKCEEYLNWTYSKPRPSEEELYELASILRVSAKEKMRANWVLEEVEHTVSSSAINLSLNGQYFVKSLNEPAVGSWDPSLQTIPSLAIDIDSKVNLALVDPELLSEQDLLQSPEAEPVRNLYELRKNELKTEYDFIYNTITTNLGTGYEKVLNYINTGNISTAYNIYPYASLADLVADLKSNDAFANKEAANVAWSSFRINAPDFLAVAEVKENYESNNPDLQPTNNEIIKTVNYLLSGYKRLQLYGDSSSGWIYEEVTGTFSGGGSVLLEYYNVRKMRMASYRSDSFYRENWQKALLYWNRQPWIQPDLVPPENILNFISTNTVYTYWNNRRGLLLTLYSDIYALLNPVSVDSDDMYLNLKKLLSGIVSREYLLGTPSGINYLDYFLKISDIEASGNDIRPYLSFLGISVDEYRVLVNIYKVLEDENTPSPLPAPTSLLSSECEDAANIFVAIHSRYTSHVLVLEEYYDNVILSQEYFQNYELEPNNFPLSNINVFNKWRSPWILRKAWASTINTRITEENACNTEWSDLLMQVEDDNVPFMRDALIRALREECESFEDAAERLAKTYFIETKDNCCVKHTRVSFAIETLQGLLWALETGVYDDFIASLSLIAPNFKEEWKWIGSYATWKSAMFVFLYPENLLYPTLKRVQTPAFYELSQKLQNTTRFTPDDACETGKEFQLYLEDIESHEVICTANAESAQSQMGLNNCCGSLPITLEQTTFFIAQGNTGKKYWSKKVYADNSYEAHSFWYPLNKIPLDAKVVGCYPLLIDSVSWLYLFFSVWETETLTLGYIRMELHVADSSWQEPQYTADLPVFLHYYKSPALDTKEIKPISIVACQQSDESINPHFIFEYPREYGWSVDVIEYNLKSGEFVPNTSGNYPSGSWSTMYSQDPSALLSGYIQTENLVPFTGLRHNISVVLNPSSTLVYKIATTVSEKRLVFLAKKPYMPVQYLDVSYFTGNNNSKLIAVYESLDFSNTLIVLIDNVGSFEFWQLTIAYDPLSLVFTTSKNQLLGIPTNLINKIAPSFSQKVAKAFYATRFTNKLSVASALESKLSPTPIISLNNSFMLGPGNSFFENIQSADCTTDMNVRMFRVQMILTNYVTVPATPSYWLKGSNSITQLLYEAYYFVPMLLALDQQRRGQFEAALSWYRSVYDYTNPLVAKRKIFYGLVLEESITSVYTFAPNWLLDPLNPHLVAQTRTNAYSKYTIMNIIQCLYGYADREFTLDTIESLPRARKMYTMALDLLKIPELEVKENICIGSSVNCIETLAEVSTSVLWERLLADLETQLSKLGNPELIEDLAHDIAELLNTGDEETYPSLFAGAFDLIDENTPTPVSPTTISQRLSDLKTDIENASRYIAAINNPDSFSNKAGDLYALNLSKIVSLPLEEIDTTEAESRLQWLLDATPDNTVDYSFSFASSVGVQNLSGSKVYNPLDPTEEAFNANLIYSNAKALPAFEPPSVISLITYKFCTPLNPIYSALILKGNLELYKIFNCRNIAGIVREVDVFAASTDSTSGMPVIGASGNLSLPGVGNFGPSNYRFRTLLERAKQLAQQAQQLESLFLAALEKEDAENYSQFRAKQDLETAKATVKLQDLRISQAKNEKTIADLQLGKVTFIQNHYADLIAAGLNEFEQKSLEQLNNSVLFQQLAAATNGLAAIASAAMQNPAGALSSLAAVSSSISSVFSILSSINSQLASFARRQEEWEFQRDLAGIDINIANQQIKIADDNIRIVGQEREIASLNTNHAEDSLSFLKNKFTNAELYNWMGRVLEQAYNYMLNIATATARAAESQLYFERQQQAGPFILNDYWELPSSGFTSGTSAGQPDRRGLTGSARLLVDIQRLDQYAFESNKRKLQLTKVISLAQNFPSEFQQFKETGIMNFELTNKYFDYDFPGHYLRLINSVKTTVVGLLPVYDGIKATLTAESTSYTVIGGTTFQSIPIKRLDVESVALSSPNNASGLFELQPIQNQELLNPFEGMGIESRWEFKMPQFSNRIDYANIADVLITVEYTALDSFQYRYQVLQDLENALSFNRGFSFKNNFPDQWYELGQAVEGDLYFSVNFELKREFFPQGIQNLEFNGNDLLLYFARADEFTGEIKGVVFNYASSSLTPGANDTTTDAKLSLTPAGVSPLVKLQLVFDNTPENRELFSEEKVKDILLLVGCKAELKSFPL